MLGALGPEAVEAAGFRPGLASGFRAGATRGLTGRGCFRIGRRGFGFLRLREAPFWPPPDGGALMVTMTVGSGCVPFQRAEMQEGRVGEAANAAKCAEVDRR